MSVAETPASQSPSPVPAAGDAAPQGLVVNAVLDLAGRATLPYQEGRAERNFGTAFWYNDLVDTTMPGREVIRQYLVTAEPLTRHALGQWTLRSGLSEPEQTAGVLMMPDFAEKWIRLPDLGIAVMPTVDLHRHAEAKRWSWTTEEITEGLAARDADIAAIGTDPLPAYLLGHGVGPAAPEEPAQDEDDAGDAGEAKKSRDVRPQAVVPGTVVRDADGSIRWHGPLPAGYAGAPVFAGLPLGDEQFNLVCAGLVLPGEAPYTVATFDRIRPAVRALAPTNDLRRRHWWQRSRKS